MNSYVYSCRYRRSDSVTRVWRRQVIARNPDEARRKLAILDPQYHSTVETPKRRAVVEAIEA